MPSGRRTTPPLGPGAFIQNKASERRLSVQTLTRRVPGHNGALGGEGLCPGIQAGTSRGEPGVAEGVQLIEPASSLGHEAIDRVLAGTSREGGNLSLGIDEEMERRIGAGDAESSTCFGPREI